LIDVIPSWVKLLLQLAILGLVIYRAGLYEFQVLGFDIPLWLGIVGA
jgi:hypothetical protein